jgi:DNA-binding response OmpR family regulator
MSDSRPTVLVIDDEPDLADLYAAWLTSDYEVRTAYGGEEALGVIDDDVSVALIDRLMPDLSGDEVLERIREQGYDCRVAMVTAVEPDFDIIDMGFDDYLVKPVRREELQSAVESLLTRTTYDTQLREYFALVSKRAALEAQKSDRELAESEAYAELTEEIEGLRADLDETTSNLSADDFEVALRQLDDF